MSPFERALWQNGDFQRQANFDNTMYSMAARQEEMIRMEDRRLNENLAHSTGQLISDLFTDIMTGGK